MVNNLYPNVFIFINKNKTFKRKKFPQTCLESAVYTAQQVNLVDVRWVYVTCILSKRTQI